MLVLAQALFAVVLSRLPALLRLRFYPSYAAMTFPFVITATALGKARALFQANGLAVPEVLNVPFAADSAVSAAMVGYALGQYLRFFFKRIEAPQSAAVIRKNKQIARFSKRFENEREKEAGRKVAFPLSEDAVGAAMRARACRPSVYTAGSGG